jgi:SAM-dependent methyltransferase
MSEPHEQVFFEVFEALPRQGPGSRECTARALALCRGLPARPAILDLGCGAGAQTLDLASLTDGTVDALDTHAPFIARLAREVAARGLQERVRPAVGDMARPPCVPHGLDLIWCEGAAYFLGIENALRTWRPWLRPGGFLAFTEVVWLRADPPGELRAFWTKEYPQITDAATHLATAARCGYQVAGHFTLPASAWWTDFYTPMEARVRELRLAHAADARAATALDAIQAEIDLHRRFGAWYSYEFFVLRAA